MVATRWYNTTYALYATMILLYVVLSDIQPQPEDDLLHDVEKGLELFRAMNQVVVARRCAEITREVLDVARKFVQERRGHNQTSQRGSSTAMDVSRNALVTATDPVSHPLPDLGYDFMDDNGFDVAREDLLATLVDCNLMDSFADFDNGFMEVPSNIPEFEYGPVAGIAP